MTIEDFLKGIDKNLTKEKNTIWIKTEKNKITNILKRLKDLGAYRMTSITGVDLGKDIEVIYHLIYGKTAINLRTLVSKKNPEIRTVTDIYPGANLYERELYEMLGVISKGHPDLKKLFLAKDSPKFPLRRE
jgi:NADH-quinone oxidoreductase subunit C